MRGARGDGREHIATPWTRCEEGDVLSILINARENTVERAASAHKIGDDITSPLRVFVVTVEPGEAGVITHKLYRILGLKKKLLNEPLLLFGILTARHKKIVAHEYALSVALIEEAGCLKETASPYAEYICAHFLCALYKSTDLALALLGGKWITGHPVSAAAEYLLAVDYDLEAEEVIVIYSFLDNVSLSRL